VKIIGRYVLKEHVGPFVFASTALTSLMLLQYIAKRFGDLVGKGLPASVITEFMALSLPFTIAMTLPMAVLVAVLYAFSRLAAENEITALKASGVGMRSVLGPVMLAGVVISMGHLAFLDGVLPA
jgi:lipopolysaccharide export system permease protein